MLNFLCGLTLFASLCGVPSLGALSPYLPVQGGTGSTTLSGILKGNGTSAVGTLKIGSNLSFDGTTLSATGGGGSGLSTTTPLSDSNILTYSVLAGGKAYGTATSSASCSGSVSCSAFTVVGAVSPTITSTALLTYDAWTHAQPGQSATTSAVGIGTTSPWAQFSIATATASDKNTTLFSVGSSSNATLAVIQGDGDFALGTSSPWAGLFTADSGTTRNTNTYLTGSIDGFLEANIQNRSNGASASSDWTATADNGTPTTHYIDLGINGSGGSAVPFTTANHAYLYSVDDTLNIGALGASSEIRFHTTGGISAPAQRVVFDATGKVGIATTTIYSMLGIAGKSTSIPLIVGDAPSGFSGKLFDLKVASSTVFSVAQTGALTLGTPLTVANGGTGVGTFTSGQLLYGNLTNGLSSVATSAPVAGNGITISGAGALIGAATTIMNPFSVATTSSLAVSQLGYVTVVGGSGTRTTFGGVGTSTPTCSGIFSCTNATVVTNAAGATTFSAVYDAWTHPVAGSVAATTSAIGVGTSTPTAQLAVSTSTQSAVNTRLFAVASTSSSVPDFLSILGNGFIGFATATPTSLVSINANALTTPVFSIGSTTSNYFTIGKAGNIVLSEFRAATSTAAQINWINTAPAVLFQTGTSATTINLINATTSDQAGSRKIVTVCNPATTAGAITWRDVEWSGGAVPTQTTTANQCDVYSFIVTAATSTTAAPTFKVFGSGSTGFK